MKPQHVQFWPWNDPWHGNFDLTDDCDRSCELDDWPMNRSCPNTIFFHIRTACMTIKAIFCSNCSLFTEMLEHFFLQNTKIYIKIWYRFQTGCFVSSVFPTNRQGTAGENDPWDIPSQPPIPQPTEGLQTEAEMWRLWSAKERSWLVDG